MRRIRRNSIDFTVCRECRDRITDAGSDYCIDAAYSMVHKVADESTGSDTCHRSPVDIVFCCLFFFIRSPVQEIVSDDDGTDWRKGPVQEAEPADEVSVQPDRSQRTCGTGRNDHRRFSDAGDIGQSEAGGI